MNDTAGTSRPTSRPDVGDLAPAEVEDLLRRRLEEAFAALGCVNLAVFGKTGSGKSTLVNAIFGQEVADTGIGHPVTRDLAYHRHPGGFLGLLDSEGFETGTGGDAILAAMHDVVQGRRDLPVDEQVHAAWYLVRWSDRRFEDRQADFVRALHAMGLPVLVVVSQVPSRDGRPHPEAVELADHIRGLDLPIHPQGRAVLTNARADPFTGAPVLGLRDLLDATYGVVPVIVERALTAAQVLDLERKRRSARTVIAQSAALAGGIGATPIPLTDAALLIPAQVTMIARITAAYGLPADRSRALAVAGSVVLTGGATMAGRYAVTTLLKFVPGGALAGSAVSAAVAATLTTAVGEAWARVCEHALGLDPQERDRFLSGPGLSSFFLAALAEVRGQGGGGSNPGRRRWRRLPRTLRAG